MEVYDILKMTRGDEMVREVNKLFSRGCELWMGQLDGKLAGICWSCSRKKRSDYFVPLEESDATILSCFVLPVFRGRKIYPSMLETMVNTLLSRDQICNVYIDCKSWNTASIRGIQKAGFIPVGKAVRMVLFEHVWILWNRCKRQAA
ncbi:MAG: GNAT family N-acetyltransferase [Sedimentisphaerales bacterium]|nr:GNAT family N-acetyltransferase [Sedimentisphaerales bacterium]